VSSMGYCVIENTVGDLRSCLEKLEEAGFDTAELTESEERAAKHLIKLCCLIADGARDEESEP